MLFRSSTLTHFLHDATILYEAADEIDRLLAENAELRKVMAPVALRPNSTRTFG